MSAAATSVAPPRRPRQPPPGIRRRRFLYAVAQHALLIGVALAFVLPIMFMVLTSLMTDHQALTSSVWPHPFRFSNYRDVFDAVPLGHMFWNTFLIAGLSSVGVVLSSVPVAYALSRMSWRGRDAVFLLVIATMMLPFQVTVIPLYVIFVKLHWIGSFKPLIVPSFFGDAFSIFLLRQFMLTIPTDLSDAGRVDGASEIQLVTRVIVPLIKPAIVAVALFNFLYNWNDYFAPLLYLGESPSHYTLSLGLADFRSVRHVQWNLTMAASIMFMLPTAIMFFLAQKVFVEGITVTGIKE
jgi:multiple sugar transport system permease protein